MRIAALFMPSPTPPPLPISEQATSNLSSATAHPDMLTSQARGNGESTSAGTGDLSTQAAGCESAFGLSPVPESSIQGVTHDATEEQQNLEAPTEVSSAPPDLPYTQPVSGPPDSHPEQASLERDQLSDISQAEQGHTTESILADDGSSGGMSGVSSQSSLSASHSTSMVPADSRPGHSLQASHQGLDAASSTGPLESPAPVWDGARRSELASSLPAAPQGLLTAIETPLGGPDQDTDAEQQAAATAVSAMALEGVTDMSTLVDSEQQDRSQPLPSGTSGADADPAAATFTPRGLAVDTEEEVETKPQRKEQFSLEIVRCKIVCPAKTDSNAFTDADPSPLDHTLYMEIPHFLLQLPLSQPAQHPRPHPVDLSVRHVMNQQQPVVPPPDATAPSPFAASSQQGTIFSLSDLALYVALPEEFDSPESVTSTPEAHAQLPPLLSIPTASLIALAARTPPQHTSLHSQMPQQAVPAFELEMKTAEVIAKPKQLQTISASTIRYSTEMDNILGKPTSDPLALAPTAAAEPPLQSNEATADGSRDRVSGQPSPRQASRARQDPGFALEAFIGLISLQLHSSNAKLPALVLQWQRLSGRYAEAAGCQQMTACGLTWHYLALHLTENPAEPRQQFSLEHVGTLRSGSLLLPGRISRVHSEPLGSHGAPSSSRSSSKHGGSGRPAQGPARGRHMAATTTISPEEEFLSHQHSLSRLHVGPIGNGRSGLGGLTGLAEIAADEEGSTPSSPQYIFNNRARLASDSFNEMLEGILPSLSALSLQKASNHQQANSENDSSSLSGTRSHRRHRVDRLKSLSRAASVASSTISIEELQRQVPVIRHRSVFMRPTPPTTFIDPPGSPDYASAAGSFDLSSASSYSARQGLTVYHDAPDRLNSNPEEGGVPTSPGGTPLPEGWSPNMLPAGDRLLLLLGSKECFVASDGIANSSTDASIGCSLLTEAADSNAPLQSALEVCASDMMLRVYLEVGRYHIDEPFYTKCIDTSHCVLYHLKLQQTYGTYLACNP